MAGRALSGQPGGEGAPGTAQRGPGRSWAAAGETRRLCGAASEPAMFISPLKASQSYCGALTVKGNNAFLLSHLRLVSVGGLRSRENGGSSF